ncbi:MAG: hypothetical protein WBH44_10355 [Proteocatella sp.]
MSINGFENLKSKDYLTLKDFNSVELNNNKIIGSFYIGNFQPGGVKHD